jgi:5-formyltetrahydrofolate cyclo-ligase
VTDALNKSKSQLRTRMRSLLESMTDQQRHAASVAACQRLATLEAFANAHVVMLYMPLAAEVDVTPAALRAFSSGQTVCVPRVDWQRKDMSSIEITSLDDRVLDTDEHGVRSPRNGRLILPDSIDLIVLPALAFDPQGHRLGRGGGYYDRFLARLKPGTIAVGLAFDVQVIDSVPVDGRDAAVDVLVTDRRVMFLKPARTRSQA